MTLKEKLSKIQVEFKANKSRYNSFGKYNFRSAEDILEGLKPFNEKYNVYFTVNENYIADGVIESTASINDAESDEFIFSSAIVGVDYDQKGMQVPQRFGSASSYGKKYALGNLLLIDDTADADATNTHGKDNKKQKLEIGTPAFDKAKEYVAGGGEISAIQKKYDVSSKALTELKKLLNDK